MIIIVFEEIRVHKKQKKMKLQKVASNLAKSKYSGVPSLPKRTKRFLKNENRGVKNNV